MILIFDYFETLLVSRRLDFNQGLKIYWEKYYRDRCSFEEMKAYGEELFRHLLDLHAQGLEFSFVREELPMYAEKFGGDVIGAQGAGIKSCWINKKDEEKADCLAAYVVNSTEELLSNPAFTVING